MLIIIIINITIIKMENTTISLPNELKNKIKEFGNKGETYSDIISKLLDSAIKRRGNGNFQEKNIFREK